MEKKITKKTKLLIAAAIVVVIAGGISAAIPVSYTHLDVYKRQQYAKAGQLSSAIRELGFYAVEEVALGADIVAYKEAPESCV